MRVLSQRWVIGSGEVARAVLSEVAAWPAPTIDGLRSRHFRLNHDTIQSSYLFDRADLNGLVLDSRVDPAIGLLERSGALLSTVSPDDLVELDKFSRPVFIIASPRAGGTLLLNLLSTSSSIWTVDAESRGIVEGIPGLHPAERGWTSHQLTDLDVTPARIAGFQAAMVMELRTNNGDYYLDLPNSKRPRRVRALQMAHENTLRVPFLARAFADSVFVYVHREARQNINSIHEAWQLPSGAEIPSLPGWSRGAWRFILPEGWHEYGESSLIDVAAFQWGASNGRALDDLEFLDRKRWINIDYSELVAAPRSVVVRVFALADLELDGSIEAALNRPFPLGGGQPPSPIKWRSNPEFRESALTRHNILRGRLRELGGTPAPPPMPMWKQSDLGIRFSSFVDEVAVPPHARDPDRIVHPLFHFQLGVTVPLSLAGRTRFRDRFLAGFPLAWWEDSATGVLSPFWVRRQHAHMLRDFVAGEPPPGPLSERLVGQLASAGILVTRAELDQRRSEGDRVVQAASPQFDAQRYCNLPSLLHPAHVSALSCYYESLIAAGGWSLGDSQVSKRHGWHNESVARYFHHQLTGFISRVAGEPVRPSYCYVSAYRPGALLNPHVDRKQCVFTISLWLGAASAEGSEPWPLRLQSPEGVVSVTQAPGDAVLFRGCELPHWRDRPPPGATATTIIFHYVPRDFVGVLD